MQSTTRDQGRGVYRQNMRVTPLECLRRSLDRQSRTSSLPWQPQAGFAIDPYQRLKVDRFELNKSFGKLLALNGAAIPDLNVPGGEPRASQHAS